jgi:hypothetical protein
VTTAILAKAESTIVREVPRQPAQTGDHSQVLGSSSRAPEIRPAARPAESRSQAPNEGNNAARNPTPLAQSNKESIPRSSVRDFVALSAGPLTNSAAPAIHVESRSPLPLEVAEPIRANPSLAPQEVHATPPEPPQINLNNQILLHLSGNDHASAAVRVMDRGGAVNVSVHAPDPELRNSLRSNLGELASQLTNQGWKTDVVKTAAPANSEHARGSGTPDERSSSQQQSSGNSERQPQRDRRANGRWLQEFEQQTSGQSGNSGGKN